MPLESSVLEGSDKFQQALTDHQGRLIETRIQLTLDLPIPEGGSQEGNLFSFEDLPRPKPEEFLPLQPGSNRQLIQVDAENLERYHFEKPLLVDLEDLVPDLLESENDLYK
jgi:hypothetical protein